MANFEIEDRFFERPPPLILFARRRLVGSGGDLVADVPQVFIEPAFHALLQNFHWRSHGADHAATDDSFGELEMMETE